MTQAQFRLALLDAEAPVPENLVGPGGRPADRRFSVYRNNVAVSLTEALQAGFPLLVRLVGPEFFRAIAGIFLRRHPPASPVLSRYGAEMPDFLGGFAPLRHLPYLPDVARLELALRSSYHAADAAALPPERLASLRPEALLATRLVLAPALRVLRSPHPLHAIWRAQTDPAAPPPRPGAQDVVVLRPEYDPVPHLLPPGGAAFIEALHEGGTVASAVDAAGPALDLSGTITLLLAGNALVGMEGSA